MDGDARRCANCSWFDPMNSPSPSWSTPTGQQPYFPTTNHPYIEHHQSYYSPYTVIVSNGHPALTTVLTKSQSNSQSQPYDEATLYHHTYQSNGAEWSTHAARQQLQQQQYWALQQKQQQLRYPQQQRSAFLASDTESPKLPTFPERFGKGAPPPPYSHHDTPAIQTQPSYALSNVSNFPTGTSLPHYSHGMRYNSRPLPRGPPLKPKRSGYAVWVGNIPIGTSIGALKDHFSQDAKDDIESVFLMSKSHCAFVNYRSEEACAAAVERFNHSLLGAVRLLCRLKRETSDGDHSMSPSQCTADSTGQASADADCDQVGIDLVTIVSSLNVDGVEEDNAEAKDSSPQAGTPKAQLSSPTENPGSRYFILKSLTKEDLQESLQRGTWETQVHNQRSLDEAFRSTDNVYFIFSVNKSGEYFGYARMISSPYNNTSGEKPTISRSKEPLDLGIKVTLTQATNTAPAGCIVSDSSRGTLFWEATTQTIVNGSGDDSGDLVSAQDAGKSRHFGIEWLSVRKVTFQRTKGMRNSWNGNKEVKVARDGTELETEVGRKMVSLFHEKV